MKLAALVVLAQMAMVPVPQPPPPPPAVDARITTIMAEHGIEPLRPPGPGETVESLTGYKSLQEVEADRFTRFKAAESAFWSRHNEARRQGRAALAEEARAAREGAAPPSSPAGERK